MKQLCTLLFAVLPITISPDVRVDLPPLIPRKLLFDNPAKTGPRLSPDGTRLAYVGRSDKGVANLWVEAIDGSKRRQVTNDSHRGIYACTWAADGKHLLYQQDRDGDENFHLYVVDVEDGKVRDLTPFSGVRTQNVLTDRAHPDEILTGLNRRDRRVFDMYRINLKTGAVKLDTENPGDVLSWTTDTDFIIRAATAFGGPDCKTTIRIRDSADAPWRDLLVIPFEECQFHGQVNGGTLIAGFAPDGKALYVVSPLRSDTTRLVKIDARTGDEIGVVASDPRCDVDYFQGDEGFAPAVLTDPVDGHIQAVGFDYQKLEWKIVDRALEADFAAMRKIRDGTMFIAGRDDKDTKWIVNFDSDRAARGWYVYDRTSRQARFLFNDRPDLDRFTLSRTEPIVVRSRDGLDLVGYLTMPAGLPEKHLPLIVMPHGGPWWRDRWGFEPETQFLANRGYAVIQVNFRGSTGYGKRFLNASTHQFGPGAVLRDLEDVQNYLQKRDLIDPKRVGILGGSFGGYATLWEISAHPERYACAVDIVGPSNLRTLFEAMPDYWKPVKQRWVRRMGDVEHDNALNERVSPLFHAASIRAPLLIGHGANDPRVKLVESQKIADEVRHHGGAVTFIVYPDEGHGFARPENNLDFFGRVEEFLAKHLGGRAEPRQPVAGSSAEVR